MKLLFLLALAPLVVFAQEKPKSHHKASQTKIICKTGPEKRTPGQPLRLYFNYNLPMVFEAEDPTVPYGRQMLLLAGRPVMQLFFEKAPGAAGENGELLQPMQCAFARRAVKAGEPSQVQILLPSTQVHWLSQTIGQRVQGPTVDRAALTPAGDWSFASQFERVFSVEIEDMKNFVTTQMPKEI